MKITPIGFEDDGSIPNNLLPLLIYSQVLDVSGPDIGETFEERFASNGWANIWRNGIYNFHHYHSTSHEVLGCFRGSASVLFGGELGKLLHLTAGDVVLIPAGVGHFNKGSSSDFGVIGAYPLGFDWDMQYGRPGERPKVLEDIAALPMPPLDPLLGDEDGLKKYWI
ncbi:cupin [Opitutales bacterium]|nr:cupin [Opitutales bacterium]